MKAIRTTLTGVAATNLADGILLSALPLGIAATEANESRIATAIAMMWLPSLFVVVAGGSIIDRFGVRLSIVSAQTLRLILLCLAAASLSLDSAISIWAIALLGGAAMAIEFVVDSAFEALIGARANHETMSQLFGKLRSFELVGNRLLGPVAGGFLVGIGTTYALLVAAALAAVSGLFIVGDQQATARIATPEARHPTWPRLLQPDLRVLVLFGLAAAFAVGLTSAMMVVFVTQDLGLSPGSYGFIQTGSAVGGVVGGLYLAKYVTTSRPTLALAVYATIAIGYLAIVATDFLAVIYAGAVIFGLSVTLFGSYAATVRQTLASAAERGRLAAAFRAIGLIGVPIGALVAGPIATAFGSRTAFYMAAMVHLTVAFLALPARSPFSLPADPEPNNQRKPVP